jgi:hypothetical protein
MRTGANRHQHRIIRCTSSTAKQRRPKIRLIGVSSARVDYARDTSLRKLRLETKKIMQPGANRHQHRLLCCTSSIAKQRRQTDRREKACVNYAQDAVTGKLHPLKLKLCSPAQTDINTDYFRCTSSIRKQRRPKIQTDRREQCPAWMRETQSLKLRRSILKIMRPAQTDINTDYSDALAQSRRSADPFRLIGVSSARRGLCARRSHSVSCAARVLKKYAARCTHQHRLFAALAQSRSSADPKFRLIGVSSARVDCARDAVTGKLRRSKLKSCSPVQTDINTDTAAPAQSRSSADPKIQTDRRGSAWRGLRETQSPGKLRRTKL